MISLKAMDFYKEINKALLVIKEDMDFLEKSIPTEIETKILVAVLRSSVSNSAGKTHYSTPLNGNLRQDFQTHFNKFRREFQPILLDRKISWLENKINNIFEKNNYTDFPTQSFLKELKGVPVKYQDTFMQDYDLVPAIEFFKYLEDVTSQYTFLTVATLSFEYSIRPTIPPELDIRATSSTEIYIPGIFNTSEIATILSCLNDAYASILSIVPGAKTKQLYHTKIETGSLFGNFIGDTFIMGIIVSIFREWAKVAYHRSTNDGQIEKQAKTIEKISSNIDVIKKAEAAGIKVDDAKENISQAMNNATKALGKIIEKTPGFELNGEEYGNISAPKQLARGGDNLIDKNNKNG